MTLSKADLLTYARAGVLDRLRQIEKELAVLHESFRDCFLSETPPQLARLDPKEPSRNGHGGFGLGLAQPSIHAAAKPGTTQDRIVAYLTAHGPTRAKDLAAALHATGTTIYSALDRACAAGRLRRLGDKTVGLPDPSSPPPPGPAPLKRTAVFAEMRAQLAASPTGTLRNADFLLPGVTNRSSRDVYLAAAVKAGILVRPGPGTYALGPRETEADPVATPKKKRASPRKKRAAPPSP